MSCMGAGASSKGVSPWLLETHAEHTQSVNCLALSDDRESSVVASGSDDCTVRVWTTNTPRSHNIATLEGHAKYITSLAIAEGFVLSGSADRTIRKWDLSTGNCVFVYEGHTGQVNRIISTGDFVFSSSYDTTARCWALDAEAGTDGCLRLFRGHSKAVYPLVFIPADDDWRDEDPDISDLLITGAGDGYARAWSIETGECVARYGRHDGAVQCLATDSEGRVLFTATSSGELKSWDIVTGDLLKHFGTSGITMEPAHEMAITSLQVSNKFLFTGSADRTAKSWVTEFGDKARTFSGHKHSVGVILIHDCILYTGCGDGIARAFEAKSGILRRVFKGHSHTISSMKIASDKLITGSFDGSLRMWTIDDIRTATDPYKASGTRASAFEQIDVRDRSQD